MKIGLVSDSHGKAPELRQALSALVGRRAEAIVHCGDVGSAECVELLGGCGVPAYLVPGNMDRHVEELEAIARQAGVTFAWETVAVPIGQGRSLIALHGQDQAVLRELLAEQKFPYVCHGHTHRARDERIGKVRVINPGALYRPHPPHRPTVAVLDTAADTLEFIALPP